MGVWAVHLRERAPPGALRHVPDPRTARPRQNPPHGLFVVVVVVVVVFFFEAASGAEGPRQQGGAAKHPILGRLLVLRESLRRVLVLASGHSAESREQRAH